MRFSKTTTAFLLLMLFISVSGAEMLRIGDATGGAPMDAVRVAALDMAKDLPDAEITIVRMKADKALAELQAGNLEIVFAEHRFVPASFSGMRKSWAAEALAFYVDAVNPLRELTLKELRTIWQTDHPVWRPYNGMPSDIHRIAVSQGNDLRLEEIFIGSTLKSSKNIFRTSSLRTAFIYLSPASLICGGYRPERATALIALKVNGVAPTFASIAEGKYPLSLRYELLTSAGNSSDLCKKFIRKLDEHKNYQLMLDSNLLPPASAAGK